MPVDKDEPVYTIGVAARLCDLHPQTLRTYERLGLIRPARIGSKNRVYSDNDIDRLKQIQHLTQDMGVNLAGVEVIIRLLEKMNRMQEEMDKQIAQMRKEMTERIKELESQQ